jgi:hypothetical protein
LAIGRGTNVLQRMGFCQNALPVSIHVHILSVSNSCKVLRQMDELKQYGKLAVSQGNLGLRQIAQPTDDVCAYWVQCFDRLVDDIQTLEDRILMGGEFIKRKRLRLQSPRLSKTTEQQLRAHTADTEREINQSRDSVSHMQGLTCSLEKRIAQAQSGPSTHTY